ncbi:cytochrome c biogenesis protein CcsA [bacterium]|nr:cytochrome c biogenesis protein CcsA [bacterium]
MKRQRWIPLAAAALAILMVAPKLRAPGDYNGYDLPGFGSLPVVDRGRVKPLDTLARTSLLTISTKQTFYTDGENGTLERKRAEGMKKTSAMVWMLDVATKPMKARGYEVIRIDHPDVLSVLGLDRDRKYFSMNEILANADELDRQVRSAASVDDRNRNGFQRKMLQLSTQLNTYIALENVSGLLLVPPVVERNAEDWVALNTPHVHGSPDDRAHDPAVGFLDSAFTAWGGEDPASFNAAVAGYHANLDERIPSRMSKVRFETFFYAFSPFIQTMGLYVLAFILAVLSWLWMPRSLSRAALAVLVVGLVVHTFGLVARIWIQSRPPVTNLYSSALMVGWGAVVLGGLLERWFRNGVGAVVAAVMGFLSLLVAHHLSLDGDTMTMMQAVLDTNFWLATHVVVITLGYSSTFLAGVLGIVYVLRGVLTKTLGPDESRSLARMIYGIVCFATLFSFVGTILGGIWADQSWGRFWGWDPKENGALLIVLWNALVLHARWGGMVRERGLAVLAIGGNIVTAWSWFGTNMLGVGLHAYGFIDSAVFWMGIFVFSQLAIIGLGSIPRDKWRSPLKERAGGGKKGDGGRPTPAKAS